jgi:tryptophan synthase beta chain
LGYAVGCSFDHVLLHQSIIGNELIQQIEESNLKISGVISCCGSGSNLGGIAIPILHYYLENNLPLPCIYAGVSDPQALSSDMKAKGLTGHNLSRIIEANIRQNKIILEQISIDEAAQAARSFFAEEGILVAPESSYGLAATGRILKEHIKKEITGVLVVCISGRGYWD